MALERAKKVLILFSSGGGGLIQAAIAKEQEIERVNPSASMVRRDMMKDWYWKIVGRYGLRKWDQAQREGDVKTLEWLLNWQKTGDIIFWPWIFYRALKTLFQEEIDHIIDTQPLGTSALLLALRIYNKRKGKEVVLEKIVVDLPTKLNTHFFHPIKKLSSKNKKLLRLITLQPLLDDEGQTPEEFWHKHCRITEKEVVYEYFPIRQSFRRYQMNKDRGQAMLLEAKLSNREERELLEKIFDQKGLGASFSKDRVSLAIEPNIKVMTILLGSQPAFSATLGYIRRIHALLKKNVACKQPIYLFVLCADHKEGEDTLFKRVAELSVQIKEMQGLVVIPLSFQSDSVIAPLFHRSDLTCTRSGGQTAMELMCTMRGEIWIHSETKSNHKKLQELTLKELLAGIPGWEAGNALYLHRCCNAKIVTPDYCDIHATRILKQWNQEEETVSS